MPGRCSGACGWMQLPLLHALCVVLAALACWHLSQEGQERCISHPEQKSIPMCREQYMLGHTFMLEKHPPLPTLFCSVCVLKLSRATIHVLAKAAISSNFIMKLHLHGRDSFQGPLVSPPHNIDPSIALEALVMTPLELLDHFLQA